MDEPLAVGTGEEVHPHSLEIQLALLSRLLFLVQKQMDLIYPGSEPQLSDQGEYLKVP